MLNGVNKKCATCSQKCKQARQIRVIYCPNYQSKQKVINKEPENE